ncbi:vacuolar-sorting protein SNF8 isoform X2 [Phymastichus coffea]|uniref:vacuolar-sorting protein SNF8 isoform X2 n=1 Tax=Phymastichus coffea TaxID=108790 RepID=UPI00273BA8A0|nr:vacuolar-sorting protein SNF8 isoform X2 [Phymastichus coffea]
MRRKPGVGAIQKQKYEQERYKDKGTELQENQFEQMTKQMETFRINLEEFASKHKNEIKKNAQFRRQFTEMCASIGVDPLASVCLATNYKNGGLISLDELRERLIQARGRRKEHQEITNEDLLASARKLKILGNGFSVVPISKGKYLVQSIPGELSMDHTAVLQQTNNNGSAFISKSLLQSELKWESERAQKALDHMVKEGLAWIDNQNEGEPLYWFPSLFTACIASKT